MCFKLARQRHLKQNRNSQGRVRVRDNAVRVGFNEPRLRLAAAVRLQFPQHNVMRRQTQRLSSTTSADSGSVSGSGDSAAPLRVMCNGVSRPTHRIPLLIQLQR